ncbi:MAG TPA: hypothetical protein VMD05_11145, partial [Candidatus Nanoarchaeia archaeon]|nr:hypothetical protein [Candidatus Nanoarchaeia archaeon]
MGHVAENLRRRGEENAEYEVIPEHSSPKPSQSISPEGWILGCELDDALKLKSDLMRKFEGITLPKAIPGKVVSNSQGKCYCVCETHKFAFKRVMAEDCRRQLVLDLKLLPGIGP